MKGFIHTVEGAVTQWSAPVIAAMVALGGTVIAALVGLAASLFVYRLQQRQKNKEPFLQRQLDLCFAATEAAACLAVNKSKWEEARDRF